MKVTYYMITKKALGYKGCFEVVCFVESENVAKAICEQSNHHYEYQKMETEIEDEKENI